MSNPAPVSLFHTIATFAEANKVAQVMGSGQLVMGPHASSFENAFAAFMGARPDQVVTCASGTDALVLALETLGVGSQAHQAGPVLVPAMTFSATAEAALRLGVPVVVVDVSDEHYTLTAESVRAALKKDATIGAVIVVHLYGWPAPETGAIKSVCDEFGILMIEDCAQALGARFSDGRLVGTIGDAAAFSFYPTKPLGGIGDGGAVICRPSASWTRSRRNHGRNAEGQQKIPGYNSRMEEVNAAVLQSRLEAYDTNIQARYRCAKLYESELAGWALYKADYAAVGTLPVPYVFPVQVSRKQRADIRQELAAVGIQTGVHYDPDLSGLPYLAQYSCPVAADLARTQLSLPCHHKMLPEDVLRVANVFMAACANTEAE